MAEEKVILETEVKLGNSTNSVKSLKAELRQVTNELATLEEGSAAFVNAAKKAGELKDRIGDIKDTVNAFNPEKKFQAIADSVGIAANGFAAMQGAMALFGSESEDLNKVMVKTQGAIALATGLNGLMGMGDAFKNLRLTTLEAISGLQSMVTGIGGLGGALNAIKTALLSNPLFILASVIGGIVVVLKSFYDGLSSGVEIYKASAKAVGDLKKTYTSLIDEIKDLQIENDLANGKITEKDAALLKDKNNFKKEYLKILNEANTKETEIREQAAKERDEDGFKATKNILDKLGFETATTKAAKQSLEDIERQKQENIAALRKKYSLVTSNTIIEETKKEVDEKTQKDAKLKAINDKREADEKKKADDKKKKDKKDLDDIGDAIIKDLEKQQARKEEYDQQKADNRQYNFEQKLLDIEDEKKLNQEIADDETKTAEERYKALKKLNEDGVISDKEASDAKIAIAKAEKDAKIVELDAYASVLNQASALLGKNTVEGKAVAIAAATISTYTAIAKTLGAFAGVPIPGYAIAQAIVTGIAGFAAIKNIIDTPIPNQGGGGGGGTPSMPSMPAAPAMRPTGFSTGQPSQTPPKVEPQKVYVVESDITNSQNKVARIQSKATIQ
jgi:chromosome segregation ATPase